MEDKVTAFARESFPQMSEEERREAIRSLRKLIDEEMFARAAGADEEPPPGKCPRCGHWHVVKRGKDADGGQRYLCRECSHTFRASTLKVFATTKLDRATWMRYAECHVDLLTLREVRDKCGVSLKTAWFMRHRVLEAISASMPPFRSSAGDGMQIDETYLRESFKGNRKNAECGIPRPARKRHEHVDNYEQICVLTGVNDAGDMFFEMAGRGNMTDDRAAEFLEGKVASGAVVTTDGSRAYPNVLKALDVRRHDVSPSGKHGINVVNNLHSRLIGFLDGFKGVATRRLWNYLAWFKWLWTFKVGRSAEAVTDMVVKHAGSNTYRTTWRGCKNTPYPFYDYWVKQAGWDEKARAALPLAALGA